MQQSGAQPRRSVTFGFNESPDPSNYQQQVRLNAPIRRILAGWNQVQPTADTWNWVQIDGPYASLVAAGLRPLIVALAPPCWAHPNNPCGDVDTGGHSPDPSYDAAWSEFVRRLTDRYPAAVAIEIWNEQNLLPYFLPGVDPVRYTQVLQAAYRAVKSADPTMPVISGGLFASPISGFYGTADAQFVASMYAAGAKGYMDGIGVHPYPVAGGWDGTPVRYDTAVMEQTLDRVRAARDAAGDRSTPIWITEIGLSTEAEEGSPLAVTEDKQAEDLIALVRTIKNDGDIAVAIIHRLFDPPRALGRPHPGLEPGFGVFRADGEPKPAACALSIEFQGTLSCGV